MKAERITIGGIPAIVWGEPSEQAYLCVHGKMSCKEDMAAMADIAVQRGYQVISFDLPQHGERKDKPDRCDVWNGVRDLTTVGDYAFARWREVSLFACSLGAYFSLQAYPARRFARCLFQSPILDMELLIRRMFLWFGVTEERLEQEGEIDTPIDPLRWDYYQYVLAHPVARWEAPTRILYGSRDNLQPMSAAEGFAARFGAQLTVAEGCSHAFMDDGEPAVVRRWLEDNL
ncbi:MAG: alpha/beta hydrolase [Clostridia bacterium]|nr:alpha/beta hydrolase [Clostridia bacterium]